MQGEGTTPVQGKRILVADDDPVVCRILEFVLGARGYSVRTANDGVAACEAAEREAPDLVLLDLNLPLRDGGAVLARLRASEATRDVPVLFLSGHDAGALDEVDPDGRSQGFIEKPFTTGRLLGTVASSLGLAV